MRWKTTVLLLVVTVGIGAYISLYELRQPTPEEREQLAKEVVSLPRESVTQLTLDLPAVKATLTHDGTAWRLAPGGVRAYEELVNGVLRHANPLRAERVLTASTEHPLDLKAYGLDPPVGRITLLSRGVPTTLLIGETTAVNDNRYLQVAGRPEVFVVPGGVLDDANQPIESFRDPLLIQVDPWSVEALTATASEAVLSLARRDNTWRLTQPLADLADRAEVTALLRRLGELRIQRWVDEHPQVEGLSTWGFDSPALEVTVRRQGTPPPSTTLFFGHPLPDDASLVYAKRSDEPALYAVAAQDLEALKADPHGLRDKACFELFTSLVTQVDVARDGTGWTIERTDGTWRQAGSEQPLEVQRVEAFLSRLADLHLAGFEEDVPSHLARYGLESPHGTIAVWTTDRDTPQRLFVGETMAGSESRYGRLEGRDAVVRLPESVTELLAVTPDQLR